MCIKRIGRSTFHPVLPNMHININAVRYFIKANALSVNALNPGRVSYPD